MNAISTRFSDFGFYLLRTPGLSSSVLNELNGCDTKEDLWYYINGLLANPDIMDAVYLGSEDLFTTYTDQIGGSYTPSKNKLLTSLYKYLNRMSGRATPYGKFAGIAMGNITDKPSSLELSGIFKTVFRIDNEYISYLSRVLSQNKDIRFYLTYFSNTTLYEVSNRYYYIDFEEQDNNKRSYNRVWVSKNPLLEQVVHLTKKGIKLSKLLDFLRKIGVEKMRAENYLHELIDSKIILSELEAVATDHPTKRILPFIKNLEPGLFSSDTPDKLINFINSINGSNSKIYAHTEAKHLLDDENGYSKRLFQADSITYTSSNQINQSVIDTLTKELQELAVFNNVNVPDSLKSFRREFQNRYGEMEISLMEAIDHERGIGYGTSAAGTIKNRPLLQGFGTLRQRDDQREKGKSIQSILEHHMASETTFKHAIELDFDDIRVLRSKHQIAADDLPVAFYAFGNLLSDSTGRDNVEYLFNMSAVGGVSSIPLMTRFCHLDDKLEEQLRKCAAWEETQVDESVVAEIVCLLEGRAGNILARPSLFKYEIPILGQSTVETSYQILLEDLMVSVKQNRVILRSKRLNKRVIPRLSSAHNFHYGMVVYRFLCDLQSQEGFIDLSLDWGPFADQVFTPRISFKHIILARARWKIPTSITKDFIKLDNSQKIALIKKKYKVPDVVVLVDGDNELIIDLRNPIGAEILLNQLNKEAAILNEYLFATYESPVKNTLGQTFNNELVIPFKVHRPRREISLKPASICCVNRSFQPGSEWAYLKIYVGVIEAERLLREQIPSLIRDLYSAEVIKKWFFIRYQDPDSHVRLRFHLKRDEDGFPFQLLTTHVNQYLEPLMKAGIVHSIVYDTYHRELERYGMDDMEHCESIFHIDSESTLELLSFFKKSGGEQLRWLAGIYGITGLFNAVKMDIEEKHSLSSSLRDAFLEEFKGYHKLKFKLDYRYRENYLLIEKFLARNHLESSEMYSILDNRIELIEKTLSEMHHDLKENPDIVSSLSHMYINRLFPVSPREHEMVLYHFLSKYYLSGMKRGMHQ